MATISRTGMTILGLVGVAVLSVGGTVLAAGGVHRHDDSDDHDPMMGGSMMGMMGGSMMGMMDRSMRGDDSAWADHDPMMDLSEMPSWMWEHMSQHMGVSAPAAQPGTEAADGPASGAPSDEPETEPAA